MSIEARIPEMSDKELENLHANASRLFEEGSPAQRAQAETLLPLIDAQLKGTGLSGGLLPVRSVGVKADLRTYEQPVMLSGLAPHETLLDRLQAGEEARHAGRVAG